MKEILIFAGTTEGRRLSECLAEAGISHTLCVATQYGEIVLKERPLRTTHCGRMTQEEIKKFIRKGSYAAVVDATHPYADMITENIKSAMEGMDIPYLRLKRERDIGEAEGEICYFDTNEACAGALEAVKGNILLTTGSKELSKYCVSEKVKDRLFARVLPGMESLSLCAEQGVKGKHIIAMQGPFTTEMNEAVIHQYGISCLVTKQSGISGGYDKKLEAAKNTGIRVFVIGHPEEKGYTFTELQGELEKLCGQSIPINPELEIVLTGIGMGHKNSLTGEAKETIEGADILLGARRMIAPYKPRLEKHPYYSANQIVPYLKDLQTKNLNCGSLSVAVLFSGDSGFYSGGKALYDTLQQEIESGQLKAKVRMIPGISSVSYLAACIGESYQDAAVYSVHGRDICNLARKIKTERRTYLLMSGVADVNRLGKVLLDMGMTECEIITGYQLSYEDQRIIRRTPGECLELQEEGLYTCFIKNPGAFAPKLAHGMSDEAFIRGKIPMTKEEVREVSICKLGLWRGAVVYDIGSGTGSIAVEAAGLSDEIRVYAIEQKQEALALIEQNKKQFGLENIMVIEKTAPEGFRELAGATHAFIGGSGGRLKEILHVLYDINPHMRVVISAISMETICEMREILSMYPIEKEEIVQMQVSRAKKTGSYHLMQAENPVWICAFNFTDGSQAADWRKNETETDYDCGT